MNEVTVEQNIFERVFSLFSELEPDVQKALVEALSNSIKNSTQLSAEEVKTLEAECEGPEIELSEISLPADTE